MKSINPYEYYRNIKKYHDGKIPKERNNKGNKLYPLCKVKVGNLYRHSFSALHRHNVLKKSNEKKATLKGYKKHSDKYNSKDIYETLKNKKEDKNPFWTAAREDLNDKEYNELRRYVYDRD